MNMIYNFENFEAFELLTFVHFNDNVETFKLVLDGGQCECGIKIVLESFEKADFISVLVLLSYHQLI